MIDNYVPGDDAFNLLEKWVELANLLFDDFTTAALIQHLCPLLLLSCLVISTQCLLFLLIE